MQQGSQKVSMRRSLRSESDPQTMDLNLRTREENEFCIFEQFAGRVSFSVTPIYTLALKYSCSNIATARTIKKKPINSLLQNSSFRHIFSVGTE